MGKMIDILKTHENKQIENQAKKDSRQKSFVIRSPQLQKTVESSNSLNLPADSPYLVKNYKELNVNQGASKVDDGSGLPYYQGTTLSVKKPGMVTTPIPKEQREGATLESGVKSAMFGLAEGFVGKDALVGLHNAGMKYLFGDDGNATAEDYEKYKKEQITGNANNELSKEENLINFLGQVGGNAAAYAGTNKLVSALGQTGAAIKTGELLKNTKAAKALSGTKFGKTAGKVLTNPHTKNLLAGQVADTVIQTPRVIREGVGQGKTAGQIIGDVAKQQASDLFWNAGFEAVGSFPQIKKGAQKFVANLADSRMQKAIQEDSVRGILKNVDGQAVKNGVFSADGLSDSTITAVRKIQTIADTAGKDFSEIASAVYQGKTMKELRPEIENLANWAKKMDSPGYIKRIDFDDMGRIRIERGAKNVFSMNLEDLQNIHKIKAKKSVFYFNDAELEATKKWADKFWNDLGIKSPYYKAKYGDWRATSKDLIDITEVKYRPDFEVTEQLKKRIYKTFRNADTGWDIRVGKVGVGETVNKSRGKKYSKNTLENIDELIKKAILFDTEVSVPSGTVKSKDTAFMHILYAPIHIDGNFHIAKIKVEEYVKAKEKDTAKRFFHLQNIEIPSESSSYFVLKDYAAGLAPNGTTISIADLYQFVKKADNEFYLNPGKLAEQSDSIKHIVSNLPSGKNSFVSGDIMKLSNKEIEKVIREENLPFRNAKDVRKSAAFVDKVVKDKSGNHLIGLDNPKTKANRKKLLSDFSGKTLDWLEDNLVNRHAVVKIFDKVDTSTCTDDLLQLYRQSGSTSEYIKKVKLVDLNGKEVGKSLDEIFFGIKKKDRKAFDEYLFHKYNFERWENGVPLEVDIPQGESLTIFSKLEELHPEFKTVSEELYNFNRELNRVWALDTGIMTKAQFDNQNNVYLSYIPTFREFGGKIDSSSAEKAGHGVTNIFRKAETRHEQIYDVKKLMENKIDILVNSGRKQQLNQDMVLKVLHNPGKLTSVGKIMDPAKEYKNAGAEAMSGGMDLVSNLKRLYSDNVGNQFTMSAYIDGHLYTIGISKRLYNAFSYVTAGGNQTLKAGVQRGIDFYGKHVTGNFKKLVTGLNPFFALRNVGRDAPNALITTTGGMGEMAKTYPEAFAKILKHDETFRQFCALGGADTGMMENVGKALTQRNYNPVHILERITGFTEVIPRYAEFLISLRHGDDVYTALKNSAEVTVNFSKGGRLTKNIDKLVVPYFNARLQGFYKSAKYTVKHPVKTLRRGTIALTIPTVVFYCMNQNNPHYEDLTERQKNYYFNIPDLAGPRDINGYPTKFYKVPKTDQFGFVLGTMIERGLRAANDDEEAFVDLWENFSDGFLPFNTRNVAENFYAPAWRSVVDNMILGKTDIKDFANRSIIPEDMQDLPAEKQYDENTSEIGIWLGKSLGISPKVVDYLIKSYTGFVGETVLPYFQPNVENKILQPLIKNFTVDSLYSNDIPTTWFNIYKEMKTRKEEAKASGNYREYYKYAGYTSDLWKANEEAKRLKTMIDGMVNSGMSKNSDAVRKIRNLYLEKYKSAIQKYQPYMKGE